MTLWVVIVLLLETSEGGGCGDVAGALLGKKMRWICGGEVLIWWRSTLETEWDKVGEAGVVDEVGDRWRWRDSIVDSDRHRSRRHHGGKVRQMF